MSELERTEYSSKEALAEFCSDMLRDSDLLMNMAKENPSLGQKIIDIIKAVIKNIKNMLAKNSQLTKLETQQLRETAKDYQAIVDRWEKAVKAGIKNQNAKTNVSEQKNNTTNEGSVDKQLQARLNDFEKQFDEWDKKIPNVVFTIGKTSTALKSIGVKDTNIEFDSSKIIKIQSKHPEMTDNVIKQIPKIIDYPIVIMESKTHKSRLTLFGEVYANGKPILAVLEINPTNRKNIALDVIKIASAYGKDNAQSLLNSSVIRYIDKNKKRVANWKKHTRLQLPVRNSIGNSNNNISQDNTAVNSNNMQNSENNSDNEQFQMRNADIDSKDIKYSYNELISKPDMKITVIDDSVTYNANSATRKNIIDKAVKNALSVGYKNENGNAVVYVKDIDADVIIPKRGLQHGLDRRLNISGAVTINAGEILKNAIKINELLPRKPEIKNSYVLIGAAKNIKNEPYIVSFVINSFTNELTSFDVLYSINTKKEPAGIVSPGVATKVGHPTGSTISISALLDFVNKYYPDILPEDVLKHYNYTSRPDGELGNSVLYQEREQSYTDEELLANSVDDFGDLPFDDYGDLDFDSAILDLENEMEHQAFCKEFYLRVHLGSLRIEYRYSYGLMHTSDYHLRNDR